MIWPAVTADSLTTKKKPSRRLFQLESQCQIIAYFSWGGGNRQIENHPLSLADFVTNLKRILRDIQRAFALCKDTITITKDLIYSYYYV